MKKLPDYIQAEYDATKQAAKLLKQDLKEFKNVKFSVTSACNVIGVKVVSGLIHCDQAKLATICSKYIIAHYEGYHIRPVIINAGE